MLPLILCGKSFISIFRHQNVRQAVGWQALALNRLLLPELCVKQCCNLPNHLLIKFIDKRDRNSVFIKVINELTKSILVKNRSFNHMKLHIPIYYQTDSLICCPFLQDIQRELYYIICYCTIFYEYRKSVLTTVSRNRVCSRCKLF